MMSLSNRIETYILKRNSTTLTELEGVVVSAGYTLDDLYAALDKVHRNKQIRRSVRQGEVVYTEAPKPKPPGSHLSWVKDHYPDCHLTDYGQPIPFYDQEKDGPTPYYSKETSIFYHEKNEALKRQMTSYEYTRGKNPTRHSKVSY